jgi:copper resistance protein B
MKQMTAISFGACALLLPLAAAAQMAMDHDHASMPGMDHGAMQHTAPAPAPVPASAPAMEHGRMQGGSAPPEARDPDAYSGGLHHGDMRGMDMADDATRAMLLLDRLETSRRNRASTLAFDGQAWIGGDLDKLWLKADGSRSGGRLGATRTEALWDHAIAPYWSVQAGLRHDLGDGPSRTWAALGVQGLAPYWFQVQATAYVGNNGRTALRAEADYDLRLTQRWILQPHAKAHFYGRGDPARGTGAGLSDTELGLRLRYEINRQFAPYVGLVTDRSWGDTADQARAAGHPARQTRVVLGLRIWL